MHEKDLRGSRDGLRIHTEAHWIGEIASAPEALGQQELERALVIRNKNDEVNVSRIRTRGKPKRGTVVNDQVQLADIVFIARLDDVEGGTCDLGKPEDADVECLRPFQIAYGKTDVVHPANCHTG